MSSEYPPRSQKKTRLLQRMGDRFHRIKDAIMRPSSPRLSPGSVSHALPVSRPTTSPLIIGPRPCESDQQEIPLPSDPSASELLPGAHAEPSPKPEIADRVAPNRLIGSLQALEGSIGFPPLKLALSELIGCLDMMKASSSSLKDYEQLVDEFQSMADILKPYVGELESEPRTGSIANVTQCIQRQVMEIKKQAERGTIGRLLDATEDQQDVIRRYRQIENLFRQIQCDLSIRTRDDVKKQLEITLLRGMYPVDDARYNSGYSTTIKRRGCTPETREAIHRGLQEWAANLDSAKIYWMNGMAGTGKTTIAYSFCEWLESTHRLGSSFFCSRISSSCRSLNRIIPTLAYQLARYSPAFRSTLCTALNDNPDAGTLNVVQQFEMLINKPMLQIKNAMPGSVVIVIDALDECDDVYSVRLLLDVLLKFSRDLPVKFFVASRPEHAIRDRMMFQRGSSRTIVHLHDIEESIVEKDIKKYLTEALSAMQPPPSLQQIDQLAKRSRNLFIYAATVVRYIYPEDMFVNSSARLVSMLEAVSAPNATTKNRYEDLDRLYTTVLSAAFNKRLDDEEQDHMRRALSTIVCAREPLTAATIAFLATLTEDQVWSALQSLRSVVHVPENKGLISTLHASFPEYMLDEARSNGFYCDRSNSNQALLHRCFDVMKSELRFNICQLKNSYLTDDQIEDMEARVAQWISPTLSYACRYWGVHLTLSPAADNIRGMLLDLLYNRLLFWMEVLSLSGCIGIGAPTMSQAQIWLRQANSDQDETQKQVSDARNFLTWFAANPCS
ncbi:unnamed protein product [Rhizoctonia solani]|uniref:Nephrocystin 3-like N-terminal domain-containing protein n=1 Tax=Rhizoctonia solani TaxID=456999 RepID=A0A8H3BRB3_9AGAM|nr:unnamed protein product [Rhizoctonia solani]